MPNHFKEGRRVGLTREDDSDQYSFNVVMPRALKRAIGIAAAHEGVRPTHLVRSWLVEHPAIAEALREIGAEGFEPNPPRRTRE